MKQNIFFYIKSHKEKPVKLNHFFIEAINLNFNKIKFKYSNMWIPANYLVALGSLCFFVSICDGQLLEGIYCGRENCYDVLNITREATSSEVRKSYRRLAKTTHPDLFRDEVQKYEAEQRFIALGKCLTFLMTLMKSPSFDCFLNVYKFLYFFPSL